MTSRKFNYQCDSDKQTISWATSLRAKYDGLLMYESCLRIHSFTSITEKNIIVPDIQVYHSQESPEKEIL